MLSRALSLATVTILVGCLAAAAVQAVENLEAGKSPAQIFAGTCNACHKSPRGLLRSVPASSLPNFLRQHYTTSSDMASVLSSYLVANGAADTRFQPKDGKETRQKDGAQERGSREAARQPADHQATRPQPRLRPGETPDVMRPDAPGSAAIDRGKKEKGKKGRAEEPARTEPAAESPNETAKRDEGAKAAEPTAESSAAEPKSEPKSEPKAEPKTEPKSESAKVEPSASEPGTARPDPVPAVTPAPATSAAALAAPTPDPAPSSSPPVQTLDMPSAPAGEQQPKPVLELPKPPAVAEAPALPPVPPAGPPAVPISQ